MVRGNLRSGYDGSSRSRDQYELVGTSAEWTYTPGGQYPYQQHSLPREEFRPFDSSGVRDEYSILALDSDWYPVLQNKLINRRWEPEKSLDEPDLFIRQRLLRPTTMDDVDGRGTFKAKDLEEELMSWHWDELIDRLGISHGKIREIIRRSDKDNDGWVEYKDFLETVRRYRLRTEQEGKLTQLVTAFAYAEEYSLWPPPLFMILVTLLEFGFFLYLCLHLSKVHGLEITADGPVPYCSVLIFNPHRRYEAWRFLTYMLVHIGILHFVFNMLMQILVGVFLEMQQEGWLGSLKIATVYLSGVIAGSLGTSISDPYTYIAGASGGVYALIAAHLATLALNWQEDSAVRIKKVIHRPLTRIVRLLFIIVLTVHDVGFAIYVRFFSDNENRTGFMGHFCGALAGLLVGIFVLDNRRVRKWEPFVQWISISLFIVFIAFAVVWNVFGNAWTNGNFFPRPDYRPYDDESGNCKHYDYF